MAVNLTLCSWCAGRQQFDNSKWRGMHKATQLLLLVFPPCSCDNAFRCSVMWLWLGRTVRGFCKALRICLHFSSSFIPLAFKKLCLSRKGMSRNCWGWRSEEVGWFFPFGFQIVIVLSLPQGKSCKWEPWHAEVIEPLSTFHCFCLFHCSTVLRAMHAAPAAQTGFWG